MDSTTLKDQAKRIVEELPEGATWDDLMHRLYVRWAIEAGLKDSEVGKPLEASEVRIRFGLAS